MRTINQFTASLPRAILSAIFMAVFGTGSLPFVHAQMPVSNVPSQTSVSDVVSGYVLSDGQFVYGPNIGDFNVKTYLEANAPHLSNYANDLYGRSEYYSVNPKIYLTLLEIHSHLISVPEPALMEDALGLNNGDLIAQIEYLSDKMSAAYYLHLYTYSSQSVSQRTLESFVAPSGITISVAPDTNAGTYAIIAGLAAMNEENISLILDNSQANGFYQTYRRLFENEDPLGEKNHISVPGAAPDNLSQLPDAVMGAAAPDNLLQLPFLRGLSWKFGGVHNTSGGTTFTDASSLDFYPSGSTWEMDTSNMWVVAAASGIPTRYSDCGFKISHSGAVNTGWETTYYHLEGAKYLSGSINQNDKIGVIANTEAEATCTGGAASGPHVHFSIKYNGVYVAINGTPLSGWYVHSGEYSYDVRHDYMWLERAGVKKYAYGDLVLSERPQIINPQPIKGDFDGNGLDEVGVFSSENGTWSINGMSPLVYGQNGDTPVVADYNGDGKDDIAVFRPTTSTWYIYGIGSFVYGNVGDIPVVADYNGDSKADIAVFRPTNHTWYLYGMDPFVYGTVGDIPVIADYNGDGKADIAVFRPTNSTWYLYGIGPRVYGTVGDIPAIADYNGDGKADIAVFRPSSSTWYVYGIGPSVFGTVGDTPVIGDYTGDGKADITVFRPSNSLFYIRGVGLIDY